MRGTRKRRKLALTRDGFVQADAGVCGVELPLGAIGIADGDPGVADKVKVIREALDFPGFEVKGILGDEKSGIRGALEFYGAADIAKGSVAGADVVVGLVAFDVLVSVIE